MKFSIIPIAVIAFAMFLSLPALHADVIYDSKGFEGPAFTAGPLDGQDGWVGSAGTGGTPPAVVTAPDPVQGSRAVRLEVPDAAGANSVMEIKIDDILAMGYTRVVVTYDIYRMTDAWVSNMWWGWAQTGIPNYGLQWDEANGTYGGTYPFGWEPPGNSAPNVLDRYATLMLEWDHKNGIANGYYDGVLVTVVNISSIYKQRKWSITLAHDEATGSGSDIAWIDNFKIEAFDDPVPDIKANGQDGPLTVNSNHLVTMTISLEPGINAGKPADWWIIARRNQAQIYSFASGWWKRGFHRFYGGALQTVADRQFFASRIPAGSYEFFFAVDAPDGIYQGTYDDLIEITSN